MGDYESMLGMSPPYTVASGSNSDDLEESGGDPAGSSGFESSIDRGDNESSDPAGSPEGFSSTFSSPYASHEEMSESAGKCTDGNNNCSDGAKCKIAESNVAVNKGIYESEVYSHDDSRSGPTGSESEGQRILAAEEDGKGVDAEDSNEQKLDHVPDPAMSGVC